MPIKLTVERQTLSFDSDSIGIGRSPENQLTFPNDMRVALLHATLKSVNGRWIIESRDGGPIRIGTGRPTQFGWVNAGDVIHLTESGPEIVFEPQLTTGHSSGKNSSEPSTNSPPQSSPVAGRALPPLVKSDPVPARSLGPNAGVESELLNRLSPNPTTENQPTQSTTAAGGQKPIPVLQAMLTGAVAVVLVMALLAVWNFRSQLPSNPEAKTELMVNQRSIASSSIQQLPKIDPTPTPAPAMPRTVVPTQAAVPSPIPAPTPQPNLAPTFVPPPSPAPVQLEPQELLVLVGFADPANDVRPSVFCVGWLWDEQTAIVSREVGKVIETTLEDARNANRPAQACVIHDTPLGIERINYPPNCPEIAVLRLNTPAKLAATALDQWQRVDFAEVQKRRRRGKEIRYLSYEALPFPSGVKICEFNQETCRQRDGIARLEEDAKRHYLISTATPTKLERGGLLVTEEGKIIGMTLVDSSIVWTETLERALEVR